MMAKVKKLKWELEHLGGYELLRDGPRTDIFDSHIELLEYIDGNLCVFYNKSKEEVESLKNSFNTDKDVFDCIEQWYKYINDDGGGWGTVDCNNIDGLLDVFVDWDFSTKENDIDLEGR